MSLNVHLIGANGPIGRVLYEYLHKHYNVYSYSHNPNKLEHQIKYDITHDEPDVLKLSDDLNVVIILSSNTNVDDCAKHPWQSNKINLLGPIRLFEYLTQRNTRLIYFSSDAVFNGDKEIYNENDVLKPLSVYGQQKLVCESFIQQCFDKYLILRMSKVIGSYTENFMVQQINKLKDNNPIPCFIDQWVTPVYINDIASFLLKAIKLELNGVYHLASDDYLTRYEMGLEIINCLGMPKGHVKKVSMNDIDMLEPRSKYSCLSNKKSKEDASLNFISYPEMVRACIGNK